MKCTVDSLGHTTADDEVSFNLFLILYQKDFLDLNLLDVERIIVTELLGASKL